MPKHYFHKIQAENKTDCKRKLKQFPPDPRLLIHSGSYGWQGEGSSVRDKNLHQKIGIFYNDDNNKNRNDYNDVNNDDDDVNDIDNDNSVTNDDDDTRNDNNFDNDNNNNDINNYNDSNNAIDN